MRANTKDIQQAEAAAAQCMPSLAAPGGPFASPPLIEWVPVE